MDHLQSTRCKRRPEELQHQLSTLKPVLQPHSPHKFFLLNPTTPCISSLRLSTVLSSGFVDLCFVSLFIYAPDCLTFTPNEMVGKNGRHIATLPQSTLPQRHSTIV
jgi:hypothetical protein